MPVETIDNLDDSRLEPYRDLKATNRTRWSGQFIAEGLLVVERLLASRFEVVSVLASRRFERHVIPLVPDDCLLYLMEQALVERLVGYTFHTGVLACGVRRKCPPIDALTVPGERTLLAVCPDVNDPENIGAIIRLCAGFGLEGLVLGRRCADPFSRRVLRVSMGAAFTLPIVESVDLRTDLLRLRDEFGVELNAAVLDSQAVRLDDATSAGSAAILLGNEKHGLAPEWLELCQRKVTIPMEQGADSLNVAVAAGIFFYQFSRLASPRPAS